VGSKQELAGRLKSVADKVGRAGQCSLLLLGWQGLL
jgi:hypothetical protein